jgi:two-component system cell cycle response regulator
MVPPSEALHMCDSSASEIPSLVTKLNELANACTNVLERQKSMLDNLEVIKQQRSENLDPLTGILGHTYFMNRLSADVDMALTHQRPLALAICDIDHFRLINRRFGYDFGDHVLVTIAQRLQKELKNDESLGRLGADQFAVVWAGLNPLQAQIRVEQLVRAVIQEPISMAQPTKDGQTTIELSITLRAGLALCPDDGTSSHALVDLARDALQQHIRMHHLAILPDANESDSKQGADSEQAKRYPPPSAVTRPTMVPNQNDTNSIIPAHFLDQDAQRHTGVRILAAALEARDPAMMPRAQELARFAEKTALLLKRPVEEARLVGLAALLHDVGTLGIPPEILQKPTPLSDEEWEFVRKHPHLGERLLSSVGGMLAAVATIVASHRERWDGRGYPAGLSGEQIPLGARIVGVCDAYGALTSVRPYRPAFTREEALAELRKHSGTQFDASVVEAFAMALEEADQLNG